MRFINNYVTLFGSFFILIVVLVMIRFQSKPPQIAGIFHFQHKPGYLQLITPDAITANNPFELEIKVNTNKQRVNAVGINLNFDPLKLQILDLDSSQSFCQFYPEKKFDNQSGFVKLACGAPHPGFIGEDTALVIRFMPLTVGQTTISTNKHSQILLNDGKGTNVLSQYPSKTLNILSGL